MLHILDKVDLHHRGENLDLLNQENLRKRKMKEENPRQKKENLLQRKKPGRGVSTRDIK